MRTRKAMLLPRAGALLCLVGSFAGWAAAAEPTPPSLRVSGAASLATETRQLQDAFEVQITLGDEVGRPLAGAEIHARAVVQAGAGVTSLQRCGEGRRAGSAELSVTTNASGNACVVLSGIASGSLELAFADPRGYFAQTTRSVPLPESATEAYEVGFDPPPSSLSLDQPLQTIGLVARSRANANLPEAAELVLSLAADGTERELTRVALDGFGEVHRLSLVSASFGSPGPARLVARLRARDGQERARASVGVLRTATVALELSPGSAAGAIPGSSLEVRAASALGPVPSGVVEARSQGRSVAAAPVARGHATLTLPSLPGGALGPVVTLEYVGEGPGWLSGPVLELRSLPPARSFGRYALWIAAALLAGLAVALGWRRPARARPTVEALPVRPRASLEVIEALGAGAGYRGSVRDAHEGAPVSPAVLSFIAAEPGGRVLLQISTAADGSFQVDGSFPAGTRLEVSAPFHATLEAALPGPGVLQLSLVSRRRALLDRLVRWAERGGRPWIEPSGDPTPARVAAVAGQENEPEVERWARSLERLAYGPTPPDAVAEAAANVTEDPKLGRS